MSNSFNGLLVGGLIGGVIGLLIAPKSGRETRKELHKKARSVIKDTSAEVKGSLKQSAKEMNDLSEKAKVRASRIADDALFTISRAEENAKRRMNGELLHKRPPIL